MDSKIYAFCFSKPLKQYYQIIVLVSLVMLSTSNCFAQTGDYEQNANWIIGNTNRLNFNSNQITSSGIPIDSHTASASSVTVSDGCGNLLFVTDGVKIWRYLNNEFVDTGFDISFGDISTIRQNVLVVPRPNYPNNFYIIVVGNYGVNYVEYEVNENDIGSIYSWNSFYNSTGSNNFQCSTITSIYNYNNSGYSLSSPYKIVLYDKDNQNLLTYLVSSNGINGFFPDSAIDFSYGFPSSDVYFDHIKLFPDGSFYVLATNQGKIYSGIFPYINEFNYFQIADLGAPITGIEFSPNYMNLYYCTGSALYKSEFDLMLYNYGSSVSIPTSIITEETPLGDLRVGNDDKIYGALQGASNLLKIENPDNNTNPIISSIELDGVNVGSSLSSRVIRRGGSPYIITQGTPTLIQLDPVCEGASPSVWPPVCTNGYSGTWSPATFNNTQTTTYTFTPNGCANSVQMTVEVKPIALPTFPSVVPINSGDTLLLPNPNNVPNISGTWSPAPDNTTTKVYTFTPAEGECATSATLTINVISSSNPSDNESLTDENYIKTTTYKSKNGTNPVSSITYFDGLGRPMQQIAGKQSNDGKDIVTHIEYDAFGRQEKEYLPYVSTQSNLSYINDSTTLVASLVAQYQTQYGDANPFSQKVFETSPLNRVLKQAAPGNDWAVGTGHEIKFDYQSNSANEVKLYKATGTVSSNTISLVNGAGTVFYDPNELYKNITTDENNNVTEEFKDKEGRVVLKRTYNNSDEHDTYYVYDQFGNLTYVIPPKADGSITTIVLNELCYQYKYDYRNRLVEKKLPGKDWEFIVYDKLDRMVATGPAMSPFTDSQTSPPTVGWMITKYDAFNRPIYTGWEEAQVTSEVRASRQGSQNGLTTALSETKTTSGTIDGVPVNYTNVVAPTTFKLLTVNYYDDYTTNLTFNPVISFTSSVTPNPVYYNNTAGTKPKGLPTASWTRIPELSTSPVKADINYTLYDDKGRAVRTFTNNYLGGFTQVDSQMEPITGRVNYTLTKHKRDINSAVITVREDFTYSAQDRLLTHTHKINNNPTQLLANNTYDELGQLISKQVGGNDVTTFIGLQKVDYDYNIRGWLTAINDIGALQKSGAPKDLFAFKLNYNEVVDETNYDGKALFNGNIAETYWRTSSDDVKRKYGYHYDSLNRLTNATYQKPENAVPVTNSYNESLSYDKNGNIQTLQRTGQYDDAVYSLPIDNLVYNYHQDNKNLLASVDDSTNDPNGFSDVSGATDYTYDANGNMKTDANKGITAIDYNHLNLPTKITFGTNGTIDYLYDAVGKKLRKKVTQGTAVTTTDYLNGFQYSQDGTTIALDFFPHAEGYVKNTVVNNANVYNYVYNYTDHLGNVRLSYGLHNNVLTILEENNYYPFGLKHKNYNVTKKQYGTPGGILELETCVNCSYKYKYNGKEYQDELGLNLYAYGYRYYDPAIARWTTMDPLLNDLKFTFDDSDVDEDDEDEVYNALITKLETAEGIYNTNNLNPYSYGYNDPVSFDDPDGRCPWCIVILAVYLLTPEPAMAPTLDRKGDAKKMGDAKAMKGNILLSVTGAGTAAKVVSGSKKTPAKEKAVEKVTEKQGSKGGPTAGKKFTPKQKKEAIKENAEKNGGQTKCETCGTKTTPAKKSEKGVTPKKEETNVDHIFPRSQGGNTTKENSQILCRDCNMKKSDKVPIPPQ